MDREKEKLVDCPDCRNEFILEDDPCATCEDTGLVVEGTKSWAEKLLFGDKIQVGAVEKRVR